MTNKKGNEKVQINTNTERLVRLFEQINTGVISVLDRLAARAIETQKVADAMDGWLGELVVGDPVVNNKQTIENGSGIGLTEALRGAMAHWIDIASSKISRYQVVTPTNWNASPKDDLEQHGAIEQALIGSPVADIGQPIEVLRVVHSFDPCLACAVHMVHPGDKKARKVVHTRPSI